MFCKYFNCMHKVQYEYNLFTFELCQKKLPPEPKCITQNKIRKNQINFAKEPNLVPEPRSGQPWCT